MAGATNKGTNKLLVIAIGIIISLVGFGVQQVLSKIDTMGIELKEDIKKVDDGQTILTNSFNAWKMESSQASLENKKDIDALKQRHERLERVVTSHVEKDGH